MKSLLAAAALVLVSTLSATAYSADMGVTLNSLAKVRFVNLQTNVETVFAPTITGDIEKGTLKGVVAVKIPEGIYLVSGDAVQPAELLTACAINPRVVVVKATVARGSVSSDAFDYLSNNVDLPKFKSTCWEIDFSQVNKIPHFHNLND